MNKEDLLSKITAYFNDNENINKKEFIKYINDEWKDNIKKERKEPTLYNLFIKEQMEILNKEQPEMKNKISYIRNLWNNKKKIKIGNTPRKALI
jgi:hypothetical protein